MALIIEEINRAQRVQARYRMQGDSFTLGRGYDNDLILEDAHAESAHAEILRGEDGNYYLRDLGTTNGTLLLGNCRDKSVKSVQVAERLIQSGDEFQIGKSRLRLTTTDTALAPALPLHSLENLFGKISRPAVAIPLVLVVAAFSLLSGYLANARDYEWTLGVNLLTGAAIGLLAYAGLWALIGRVVRHEARFFTHLSIAALGALIFSAWEWLSDLLNFNFALGNWVSLLHFAVLALLLPAMLWCASFLALNISSRWRWMLALLLPWGFLGLGAAEQIKNLNNFSGLPEYSTELKYKDALWRKPVPIEKFITSSPALFDIPIDKKVLDKRKKDSEKKAAKQEDSTPDTPGAKPRENAPGDSGE